MSPCNRTRTIVFCLLALAVLAPGTAVAAPKPPKQLCLVWTSQLDANDTWEMNLLVRAVPGKINARFPDDAPAVLKFYELNGMSVGGSSAGGFFPTLHGSGWMYAIGDFLALSVTADTASGPLVFQGSLSLDPLTVGFVRVAPDGSVTPGDSTLRSCPLVVIND